MRIRNRKQHTEEYGLIRRRVRYDEADPELESEEPDETIAEETTAAEEPEAEVFDRKLEKEFDKRQRVKSRRIKCKNRAAMILRIILSAGCVYLVFMIYCLLITDFEYNEQGEISVRYVSYKDIRETHLFDEIYTVYLQSRVLYEEILQLDYRLGFEMEEPKVLATEYHGKLDKVSKLIVELDALEPDVKYVNLKQMLMEWLDTDLALYLQYMTDALTKEDAESSDNALLYRDYCYSHYMIITENIAVLGESVQNDTGDIYTWSPESFIRGLEGLDE